MRVLTTIDELRAWRAGLPAGPGFVPTMGALHAGHAALIARSVAENADSCVSIFVNPTQFGPNEDLARYPRTLQADLDICRESGAQAVFTPTPPIMYPAGFTTWVEVPGLSDKLCGASRPGHFRGVCTVVCKLFNLVQPARAYFGRKDAQQALILTRMARDLDMPLQVITCPTVREPDGLAMSSRNRYLDAAQRARALSLWRSLQAVRGAFDAGQRSVAALRETGLAVLRDVVDKVDYLEILAEPDLAEIAFVDRPALCAVAAFVGATRLIDNISLNP